MKWSEHVSARVTSYSFTWPITLSKIDQNDLERSYLHVSSILYLVFYT